MLFRVSRTSAWDDSSPCEKAQLLDYTRIDTRLVDDPAKIAFYGHKSDWWYREGSNHRVANGCIQRDFAAQGWFVEIGSLDELIGFVKEHGRVVIGPAHGSDHLEIEIYDTYRE